MSPPEPPSGAEQAPSRESYGDPWQAFGYVVSGVGFYGVVGWLLDRWLGTSFLVAIGIFVGAGLGIYLTLKRFGMVGPSTAGPPPPPPAPHPHGTTRTEE